MARPSFSDIFYASAPGARARDEADALLNTELESSLIPKSQPAPRPGSWRTTAPGTFVRDDPSTGTVTTIENSGGTVYSKIDRYTPPPVDERKSYAEILLDDIPKRIEMVDRKLRAGDIADAERERAEVEKFIDSNRAELHKFTRYTGRDPLTQKAAATALGLATGSWLSDDQKSWFDPKVNPRSADFDAQTRGYGPAATRILKAARFGSGPEAEFSASVLRHAGDTVSHRQPVGKQPTEPVPAVNRGTDSWSAYAEDAMATIGRSLPESVVRHPSMIPDSVVSTLRAGFDAGDGDAGNVVVSLAARAASDEAGVDDLSKVNLLKSAMTTGAEAMKAYNPTGDPITSQSAGKVLSSLYGINAGQKFASSKQNIVDVMRDASQKVSEFSDTGIQLNDSQQASLARMLYKRKYASGAALDADEARMADAFAQANKIGNSVYVPGLSEPAAGGKPREKNSFDVFADLARNATRGALAAAVKNGTNVSDELVARSSTLEPIMQALGVTDKTEAASSARLLAVLMSGGERIDFTNLPKVVENNKYLREYIKTAAEKENERPPVTGTFEEKVLTVNKQTLASAKAEVLREAESAKKMLTPEEVDAAARERAGKSVNEVLFRNIKNVNPAKRVVSLREGSGDKLATEDAFTSAVSPAIPNMVFESSPMFRYLYEQVPTADLGKPETLEKAAQLFENSYTSAASLAAAGSDKEKLRAFAASQAARIAGNIREALGGTGESSQAAQEQLGGGDDALKRRVARGYLNSGNQPSLTPAGPASTPFSSSEIGSSDIASGLAGAFFATVKPTGPRGFATAAKAHLDSVLAGLPVSPDTTVPQVNVDLARIGTPEQVKAGYEGLKKLTARLNEPIRDELVGKLVYEDLPKMLAHLPLSFQMQGRQAALQLAHSGSSADEIMASFTSSFKKIEEHLAKMKAAEKAGEIPDTEETK